MGYYLVNDTDLTAIANAIRAVSGKNDQIIFNSGFISEISSIIDNAVTTTNLTAENIKKGVVVKVGDANNTSRIKEVTGTCPYEFVDEERTYTLPLVGKTLGSQGPIQIGTISLPTGYRLKTVSISPTSVSAGNAYPYIAEITTRSIVVKACAIASIGYIEENAITINYVLSKIN